MWFDSRYTAHCVTNSRTNGRSDSGADIHPNTRSDANTGASADLMVQDAINRGLRWDKWASLDGVPGMDLTQLFEVGSRSVTEALNSFTSGSSNGQAPVALTWALRNYRSRFAGDGSGYFSQLQIFPLPSVRQPTRLLISADPVGRSLTGYYNAMVLRYQTAPQDPASSDPQVFDVWLEPLANVVTPSIARHGRLEGYADYSNAGYMTGAQARDRAAGILGAYQAVAYTQEWTATPGQVLTLGGTPVDLGTERAGEVYRVLGADLGAGGEVSAADQVMFLGGGYMWDDVAQAARITPYNFVSQDFSSLVAAMAPPPVMPANLG
jgi:hypothetical protein